MAALKARAERALEALTRELGRESVPDSDRFDASEFTDPYRSLQSAANPPVGVVYPTSTEQIQTVLRIASECAVPVWTHSAGRNYGYGGAEPRLAGSIALSLRRMNRILDIDDVHGVAVLEPGVTFFDLHEALRAGGYRWGHSVPDLGWGSVIGNALEHGLGYTSAGEHVENLCGMEVVLASGEVLRTGTAGMSGSPNAHLHRRGFGPSIDGLFGQSNFGVVTSAGVWLTPEPEVLLSGRVSAPREQDIRPLVDAMRPLMFDGTVTALPLIEHGFGTVIGALPPEQWQHLHGPGNADQVSELLAPLGVGLWTMRLPLAGRRTTVAAQRAIVEAALAEIPGLDVKFTEFGPPFNAESLPARSLVEAGVPNMGLLRLMNPWGGRDGNAGHLDFSPALPFSGDHALSVHRAVHAELRSARIPVASACMLRRRGLIYVNMLMFDRTDEGMTARVTHTYAKLQRELAIDGYGLYRTHIDHADAVAAGYDYGDHSLQRVLGRIKRALDPAGILSPGKQGIWPTNNPRPLEV